MQKMAGNRGIEMPKGSGRVLARILAEDLCRAQGGRDTGSGIGVDTVTDLGDGYDLTYRGSDAGSY